jgi:chromosome partitioning protein
MTTVIAVANSKGGVAKTTTCLSLGGALAKQGQLVTMVDLDPQAHLTGSLGFDPEEIHGTVADAVLGQGSLASISRETDVYGLDLAPANQELVVLDKVLYERPGYEYRLRKSLTQTRHQLYDFVVVDSPPTFGTLMVNALTAADLLIIPVQCEYYAVQSLRQMLDMTRLVRRKTNPHLGYRLLVTMYDMRNKVHPMVLEYLRKHFGEAMFETIIQVDTRLREGPAYGLPVTEYAPKTRAARQYRAVASELIDKFASPADDSDDEDVEVPMGAPPSSEAGQRRINEAEL